MGGRVRGARPRPDGRPRPADPHHPTRPPDPPLAASVVADVESEWSRHLGKRRMQQLRETLAKLREITDPYAPLSG
jgi:hypothetical protein